MKKVSVLIILLLIAAVLVSCGHSRSTCGGVMPIGWYFESNWDLKALGILSRAYPDDYRDFTMESFYGDGKLYETCLETCADITIPCIEERSDIALNRLEFSERQGVFCDGTAEYDVGNFSFHFWLDFDLEHTISRSEFQEQYQEQKKTYVLESEDRIIYVWPLERKSPDDCWSQGAIWLEDAEIGLGIYNLREEAPAEEPDLSVLEDFSFLTVEEYRALYQGPLFSAVCLSGTPERVVQEYFWDDPKYFTCEAADPAEIDPEMLKISVPYPKEEDFSLEWLCYITELERYVLCYDIGGFRYLFTVRRDPEEWIIDAVWRDFSHRDLAYKKEGMESMIYVCSNEQTDFPEYLYTGLVLSDNTLALVKILRDTDGDQAHADPAILENFTFLPIDEVLQLCSDMGPGPRPV